MKKLILTTFVFSGIFLGVSMYTVTVVKTNNVFAKEVELRHGADDAPDEFDDHGGRNGRLESGDDRSGSGRGRGKNEVEIELLGRRGNDDKIREVEHENEHEAEIEIEARG